MEGRIVQESVELWCSRDGVTLRRLIFIMNFRMIVVMMQIECGVTIREEEEDTQ